MKRYDVHYNGEYEYCVESIEGEWIPADVGQALYDALVVAASSIDPHDKDSFDAVNKALSLADGEKDNG